MDSRRGFRRWTVSLIVVLTVFVATVHSSVPDEGCAADELQCLDGSCYHESYVCDEMRDCPYAEDEASCWGPYWVSTSPDWAYDATPTDSPETSGPDKVLDYDHNTFWSPSGPGPWYIIFHLPATLKLFRIGIKNYGDKVHDVSAFKIQRSDHDNPYNWVDWITFSQPIETVPNSFWVGGIGTPGRYWRLFITATGPDNSPPWLREVEFYGMDPGPWWVYNSQDWAIDATPTVWPDTSGPDKVLDYVTDTFWKPSSPGPWYIIFDLLAPHTLSSIFIFNYGDVTHDITAFEFQTSASNDPYNWTDVVAFDESSSNLPDDFVVGGFTATSRYWRLFITATGPDNSPPWPRDVEFYGMEIASLGQSTEEDQSDWLKALVCPADTDRPCSDGSCISATGWCDGTPGDCQNDEDETDCQNVLEDDTTEVADGTTVTEALTTAGVHNGTMHAGKMTTEEQPGLATPPGGTTSTAAPTTIDGPIWGDKFPDWAYDATPTDSPETSGPDKVLDYDHNTFWSPSGPGPWYIIFHLQATLKLFRIGITNYGDKIHDVSAFKFQRSDHDNPYNWVDWITFNQPIETVLNSFTVPGIGTPGRYWRLFITATGPDNSPPWIRDVGFYGMDPGPWWVYSSQDWAIDATTTVWPDTNGPDKVLDYVKDTFWKPSGTGPWYIIFDLLTPHTLSNIAIRNYGDVTHDITAFTFQTSASNDPYNWTDVVAFEESSSLLPDDFPIVGGFAATSRYWRLFITATDPDNSPPWLRDVELYGIEIVCPAETDRPCLDGLCIPATRWCDDIPVTV
ncbi:hypothetical protein Bbelb_259340 [Branchiostoma belcheri]|nr:hypothetical protein Bbelb_259340 [Branchiostoma belcheri]